MRFACVQAHWTIPPGCARQFISGRVRRSLGSCCRKAIRSSRPSRRTGLGCRSAPGNNRIEAAKPPRLQRPAPSLCALSRRTGFCASGAMGRGCMGVTNWRCAPLRNRTFIAELCRDLPGVVRWGGGGPLVQDIEESIGLLGGSASAAAATGGPTFEGNPSEPGAGSRSGARDGGGGGGGFGQFTFFRVWASHSNLAQLINEHHVETHEIFTERSRHPGRPDRGARKRRNPFHLRGRSFLYHRVAPFSRASGTRLSSIGRGLEPTSGRAAWHGSKGVRSGPEKLGKAAWHYPGLRVCAAESEWPYAMGSRHRPMRI
jgi:hypothetical protein